LAFEPQPRNFNLKIKFTLRLLGRFCHKKLPCEQNEKPSKKFLGRKFVLKYGFSCQQKMLFKLG